MLRRLLPYLFLAILVLVAYANSLSNGFISDDQGITINATSWNLQTVLAQPYAFLRPLMYLGIYKLAGLTPWAFRIPNIVFHLFNTWLVFALVGLLINKKAAFISAVLFAVHPLAVESVAWISGGIYPQYTFFLLLSLLFYCLYQKNHQRAWYVASVMAAFFAFESTEKALILPLVIALVEFCFGNIRRNRKRLVPFFVLAVPFGLVYGGFLGRRLAVLNTTFYQPTSLIRNPFTDVPFAITTYLSLLVFPLPLSLYHLDPTANSGLVLLRAGIFFIYIILLVYFLFKDRRLFFFSAFFLVSLVPTLVPIRLAWTVAERYVYLASIGIIATIAYLFQRLMKGQRALWSLVAGLALLLSVRTIVRNADWHNEISFWTATAKTAPGLPTVHSNLALALGQKGDYEGAIKEFQTTIALKPDWVDPYFNLALSYQRAGKFPEAIKWYQKTLQLSPNLWQPYRNLAEIAFTEKRYDEAVRYLNQAIEKNPTNANLFVNLALIYQAKKDIAAAKTALEHALTLDSANQAAKILFSTIERLTN
ncbi:tetratricopeptide repeat protein [Candidatus Gottesmanbacteria bacterium]|nr:tetratricopeptide repeat protein [Candidatus Gottesmanbacteria bacterium]